MEVQGKLIIRAIPDEEVAQRVAAFICAHSQNMTTEAVFERLKKLPLVLSSTILSHVIIQHRFRLIELRRTYVIIHNLPCLPLY